MQTRVATLLGGITGCLADIVWGNILVALITAFLTGMAAYAGQHVAKHIHKKLKRKT